MNLVTNASEAIGDRPGVISVRTGLMEVDRGYLSSVLLGSNAEPGSYVVLEVSDTGSGMDKETRQKIFDPFFTTKFTGRGLGLAALLGIARAHGAVLQLTSARGRGSVFRVLFPSTGQMPEGREPDARPRSDWCGSGVVLVVEDDRDVRGIAKWMLESVGFGVLGAENGRRGLELFRKRADEIRAIVLDLTMPEMSGEEAFREIRRLRPDVPILMSSGYSERDVAARLVATNHTGFIQKPYERSQLIEKVRELLER
jgi:CheY-like chemotaxis protein